MFDRSLLQRPIILGLGLTGFSYIEFLLAKGYAINQVWDFKPSAEAQARLKILLPDAELLTGELADQDFSNGTSVCISPGIPRTKIDVLQNCPPVVSEFDIFSSYNDAPVIGVTGSNGKSTVVHLLHAMGQANNKQVVLAGNFGIPVLNALREVEQNQLDVDAYIIELSSAQLETIQHLKLASATVLNVTPDHLDRYESLDDYARVKYTIYDRAEYGLYNVDQTNYWPEQRTPIMQTFSTEQSQANFFFAATEQKIYIDQKYVAQTTYWHKKGKHFAENVMATLALGLHQGWDLAVMLEVAATYIGLKHRCQWVDTINDVAWYNDSKGTNVDSTMSAIEAVAPTNKRLIWIAGGRGKGTDYAPLKPLISRHIKYALLIGEDADEIANLIADDAMVTKCATLESAVARASALAAPDDVVLLSPAAASFDMFKNFEVRGDAFIAAVNALKD